MREQDTEISKGEYENAQSLAEALADALSEGYDLETNIRRDTYVGDKFDPIIDFWNYQLLNSKQISVPKTRNEIVSVFKEIINNSFQELGREDIDEAYKYFVLKTDAHPVNVKFFKSFVLTSLQNRYNPQTGTDTPHFAGFNNSPDPISRE